MSMSGAVLKRPSDSPTGEATYVCSFDFRFYRFLLGRAHVTPIRILCTGGDVKRAGLSARGDDDGHYESQKNITSASSASVSTDSLPAEGHAPESASETPSASGAPIQEPLSQTKSSAGTGINGSGGASTTESLQSAGSSENSGASQPPAVLSLATGTQRPGSQGNLPHLMGYFQQQPPPAMGAGGLPGLPPAVNYHAAAAHHAVMPRPDGQGSGGLSSVYLSPPPPTMHQPPPYSFMSHPTDKAEGGGGAGTGSGEGSAGFSAEGSQRYFPYGGQYEQYGLSMGAGMGHNPYAPQQQQQQQHLGTSSRLHPGLQAGMSSGSTHPAFGHPSLSALAAHHNPFGLLQHPPGAALMANMVGGASGVQLGQHPGLLHSAMSGYGGGALDSSMGVGVHTYEPPRVRGPTCMSCARSKVKCDRTTPCARCVRLRLECRPRTKVRGQSAKITAAAPPRVAELGNSSNGSSMSGPPSNSAAPLGSTPSSSDGSAMPPPLSTTSSEPPMNTSGSSGSGNSNHRRGGLNSLAPLHVTGAPFGSSLGMGALRGPCPSLLTPPSSTGSNGNGPAFDFGSPANAHAASNAPAGGSFDSVSTLGFGASSLSSQDLLYFDYQAAAYAHQQQQQHHQYEQQQRQPQAAERAYYQFQRDQEQAEFNSRQLRQNSETEERPPSIEEEGAEDGGGKTNEKTHAQL